MLLMQQILTLVLILFQHEGTKLREGSQRKLSELAVLFGALWQSSFFRELSLQSLAECRAFSDYAILNSWFNIT
jgi:hypothetical protein